MTDITERLRLRNDPSQMLMCYPPRPAPDMLCYEAAAEIKRLRAALQAIAQCPIPARLPGRVELWSLAVQMQETAIAALKEGEKKDE